MTGSGLNSHELFQAEKLRNDFETCANLLDEYFEPWNTRLARSYHNLVSGHPLSLHADKWLKRLLSILCTFAVLGIILCVLLTAIRQHQYDIKEFSLSSTTRIADPHIFAESEDSDASQVRRININTATVNELTALPGIGPVLAQRIAEDRKLYGSFNYPADLLSVSGIGEKTLARLLPYLDFDENPNVIR